MTNGKFQRVNKHLVVKWADVKKHLFFTEQQEFCSLLESIHSRREYVGKKYNTYVVVNEDEPYAEKVWQMIQEQWEKENDST